MQSNDLAAILAPFALMANRHALSAVYKTLEISPTGIRGCSPYGILEADAALDIPETIWIDAASFIGIVKSLPKDEIKLSIKSNALIWECGLADGKLGLSQKMEIPETDFSILKKKLWEPSKEFSEGLALGSLSCGPQSMASAGVFGAEFVMKDGITLVSSDSVTMSACKIADERPKSWPERITLIPDALELLISCLKIKAAKPAKLDMQANAIYLSNGALRLMLRPAPALKQDILGLCENYASRDAISELPGDRIKAFVSRATSLAESKQHTYVSIRIVDETMLLSFAEGAASSDEYYLSKDLAGFPDLPEIHLDALRVARALSHCDKLALDHVERGVIIFFNENPNFSYLISGKQRDE
jgi:hypothetical protein